MNGYRDLWSELTGLDNLFLAARRARKGKRSKPACAAFEFRLENEVLALHRRFQDGSYSFGPYSELEIREPKPRRIAAAPYPTECCTTLSSRCWNRAPILPSSTTVMPAGAIG